MYDHFDHVNILQIFHINHYIFVIIDLHSNYVDYHCFYHLNQVLIDVYNILNIDLTLNVLNQYFEMVFHVQNILNDHYEEFY